AGLFDHFSAIAAAVEIPIMLYSVPGRTGVEIAPDTAARLAKAHANIVGIKEAGGKVERITELRRALGEEFVIHSGDDGLTLPFLAVGADGVTSVASNLLPNDIVALH
ncbi:dihydrodipicolinate synthase family protein, partial [Lysobacter sp. 2RAB21]